MQRYARFPVEIALNLSLRRLHFIMLWVCLKSKDSLRAAVGEELTPERSEAKMLQKMTALGLAILSIMASTAEARKGILVKTVMEL